MLYAQHQHARRRSLCEETETRIKSGETTHRPVNRDARSGWLRLRKMAFVGLNLRRRRDDQLPRRRQRHTDRKSACAAHLFQYEINRHV